MSGTPGPAYIEYPSHVILSELDVSDPLPPHRLGHLALTGGLVDQPVPVRLIRAAESPILLVGHGVHTSRTGAAVRELAELGEDHVGGVFDVGRAGPCPERPAQPTSNTPPT
ncbi:hypothetical protein MAHJHV57_49700 [Mycobacterium avium subsp. hominissuis]